MKKILVKGASGSSQILVGESIGNLLQYIDPRRTIIITDSTVGGHYRQQLPDCRIITIGLGEKVKTPETVSTIFQQLVDLEADRSTFILGVGGGIVCDITGFCGVHVHARDALWFCFHHLVVTGGCQCGREERG